MVPVPLSDGDVTVEPESVTGELPVAVTETGVGVVTEEDVESVLVGWLLVAGCWSLPTFTTSYPGGRVRTGGSWFGL